MDSNPESQIVDPGSLITLNNVASASTNESNFPVCQDEFPGDLFNQRTPNDWGNQFQFDTSAPVAPMPNFTTIFDHGDTTLATEPELSPEAIRDLQQFILDAQAPPTAEHSEYIPMIDPTLSGTGFEDPSLDWFNDLETTNLLEQFHEYDQASQSINQIEYPDIYADGSLIEFISPELLENTGGYSPDSSLGLTLANGVQSLPTELQDLDYLVAGIPQPLDFDNLHGMAHLEAGGSQEYSLPSPYIHHPNQNTVDDDGDTELEDFDDDATIDEEEYRTPFHSTSSSGVSNVREYLLHKSDEPMPKKSITPSPKSDTSIALQSLDPNAGDQGSVVKRGRGRPIVPGSKRQRRIQAMAQPDYVPPKRGRPRTSERHLRKRSRRAANKKLDAVAQEDFSATLCVVPEETPARESSFPPTFEDESGYKPIYFILSEPQIRKIAQIFNLPEPDLGWSSQVVRWQVTCNLRKLTPTGEFLSRMVGKSLHKQAGKMAASSNNDKENTEPFHGGFLHEQDVGILHEMSPQEQSSCTIGVLPPELRSQISYVPYVPQSSGFPDRRLKIIAGQSGDNVILRCATGEEVMHKLQDERDVYFRSIIWEFMKGSRAIDNMEFIGNVNSTWGRLEFV